MTTETPEPKTAAEVRAILDDLDAQDAEATRLELAKTRAFHRLVALDHLLRLEQAMIKTRTRTTFMICEGQIAANALYELAIEKGYTVNVREMASGRGSDQCTSRMVTISL